MTAKKNDRVLVEMKFIKDFNFNVHLKGTVLCYKADNIKNKLK